MRTDSWLELLRLPQFGRDPLPERAKFQHVLYALGLCPPVMERQVTAPLRAHKMILQIRKRMCYLPIFRENVFSKTMGVAHSEWTDHAARAFNLEEPPTPYEVATFTLGQRAGNAPPRRFFQGIATRAPKIHTSAFQWWLMGLGDEVLEELVPGWEGARSEFIKTLMGTSSFAMWALGTNLMPIVRTRAHARALLTEDTRFRKVRRELYDTTYVQTLLKLGKRPHPVPRNLPALSPVFRTKEEKEEYHESLSERKKRHRRGSQGNVWWNVIGIEKYPTRQERKKMRQEGWGFEYEGRLKL
tara:strand:+ start:14708 stop:15607 length:900 start_codon:yes stop_codon:yes gene_type:complete